MARSLQWFIEWCVWNNLRVVRRTKQTKIENETWGIPAGFQRDCSLFPVGWILLYSIDSHLHCVTLYQQWKWNIALKCDKAKWVLLFLFLFLLLLLLLLLFLFSIRVEENIFLIILSKPLITIIPSLYFSNSLNLIDLFILLKRDGEFEDLEVLVLEKPI